MKQKKQLVLPRGFVAAGIASGIKKNRRKDLALIASQGPAVVSGCFTVNEWKAAPVIWSEKIAAKGNGRAVIVNSGNANAATGDPGLQDAAAMAAYTAAVLGIKPQEVLVCSTGTIGKRLPMDVIKTGIERLAKKVSKDRGMDAAEAILTTDTITKTITRYCMLAGKRVCTTAFAKGSGMIAPHMATMLCFIVTDAALPKPFLDKSLRAAVAASFNNIIVDGDMSTNDTVLLFANGCAQNRLPLTAADTQQWQKTLHEICLYLAQQIVYDGEGATKFIQIKVHGCRTQAAAEKIARQIAISPLFKVAMFSENPNWGRIIAAVGATRVRICREKFSIKMNKQWMIKQGAAQILDPSLREKLLQPRTIDIEVYLNQGKYSAAIWTCDYSYKYVTINK